MLCLEEGHLDLSHASRSKCIYEDLGSGAKLREIACITSGLRSRIEGQVTLRSRFLITSSAFQPGLGECATDGWSIRFPWRGRDNAIPMVALRIDSVCADVPGSSYCTGLIQHEGRSARSVQIDSWSNGSVYLGTSLGFRKRKSLIVRH